MLFVRKDSKRLVFYSTQPHKSQAKFNKTAEYDDVLLALNFIYNINYKKIIL